MNSRILTQKEMAEMSEIDRPLMSKYLTGTKTPFLTTAMRISEACNVPITIFTEMSVQKHFLGKSFLKEDVDYKDRPRKGLNDVCKK